MLLNLHKSRWDSGFRCKDVKFHDLENLKRIDDINRLSEKYAIWIDNEINKSTKEINLSIVGKFNPKDHLESTVEDIYNDNMNQCLTSMLNNLIF